ncbi:MAG: CARDB domain-containing protein, partial [Methanosarcinales archaeon]
AVEYGNVYLGSFCAGECQSRAFCVDAVNGTERWNTPTGDVCGSITVADGIVYFTTYGGDTVYALDAFNGSVVWERHIGWSDSTPAYYSPPRSKSTRSYIYAVIVHGFIEPAELHCFDAKTGEEIWHTGGNIGYWTASPVVTRNGKVFVGNGTTLSCLDAFTGEILWQAPGGPSPVVTNGFVYTVHQGRVIAYGNSTKPDLTVEAEKHGSYVVGKPGGEITAIIKNIGKSNVTKSFAVELREKGSVIDTKGVVDLPVNVNESRKVYFDWTPSSPGEHRLAVEVDPPPGNVSELDTWNNLDFITVDVNGSDLVVGIEGVTPISPKPGDLVTLQVNIANTGYKTNDPFHVRFSVNWIQQDEMEVSQNDSPKLSFTWTPTSPGTYTLTVFADCYNRINESDEGNNMESIEVVVEKPLPELGPIGGGGWGGESGNGTGNGSGTGDQRGEMVIPINTTDSSIGDKIRRALGRPFVKMASDEAMSAGGMSGGKLYTLIIMIAIALSIVVYGFWRETRFTGRVKRRR